MSFTLAAQLEEVFVVDGQGLILLEDMSLAVLPGEALTLCGPTGGGKTTVLRLLAGLVQPVVGRVLGGGVDLAKLGYEQMRAWRLQVGMAFEAGGFWANRSVFENVALPLLYHQPRAGDVEARVRAVAEELGIDEELGQPGSHAVGSVRKRALFGRALLLEPALLLCDEPQRGLLPREARRVSQAIERRRRERGMAAVYADHDGNLDPFVCQRRVFLEGGKQVDRPSLLISARDLDELGLPRGSLDGPVGDAP